jgi:mannose-6-phosphate isomerase class I
MTARRPPNYDKAPSVDVPGHRCAAGWDAIASLLREATSDALEVIAVECYPGVNEDEVTTELCRRLQPALVVKMVEALLPPVEIERLVAPFLGGDDPVFGFMTNLRLNSFFDPVRLAELRRRIDSVPKGLKLVVGVGATLAVSRPDVVIYADLARWEAQLRFRRGETGNLGTANCHESTSLKYKRAYFIDWRVADCFKKPHLETADYFLDTTDRAAPKLVEGDAVREGLRRAAQQPFRVVPFFDPAPWGGQWMKEVCDLDRSVQNFGWCFDCVPEENSLLLNFGGVSFELPSIDLVFYQPRQLLGDAVHDQFGDEFPIRFDFLDTMRGGNLSLQVHPLTEYIREHFGMTYTQDESYYLLDAGPDATVYLGLKEGIDPAAIAGDLRRAHEGGFEFPAGRYANRWPAKKHDHFLIPAGTCHCSGANSMVLEISATPYIFTFKMWDWGRMGLDGKPRPVHLDHGLANVQWERTTDWVWRNLINRVVPLGRGDGWREERTGLHELEFIETRRHWFTGRVPHDTNGGVNVLNLVEGEEAIVESPTGAFDPFVVHYAETFIVPAAVGPYTIRPHGQAQGSECATIKASVRT